MIAIATAEPFGAYHLTALAAALDGDAHHLVPYPSPVQGRSGVEHGSNLGVLDRAPALVITGGNLNPWTEAIAWEGSRRGIPVILSELAWVPSTQFGRRPPPLALITALSGSGRDRYAEHLGVPASAIRIVGTPSLDHLPARVPRTGAPRALVLPTIELRGGNDAVVAVAQDLQRAGYEVTVRPHPRDTSGDWDSLTTSRVTDLSSDVAHADVVVGSPGTAFVVAVAMGVPVIAIAGSAHATVPAELTALGPVVAPEDVVGRVEAVGVAPARAVNYVTGPIGGSAERLVKLWREVAGLSR